MNEVLGGQFNMKNRMIWIIIILCSIVLCSISSTNSVVQQKSVGNDLVGGGPEIGLNSYDKISVTSNDLIPEITWTSRDSPNSTILESGDVLEGDHVVFKADFSTWNIQIIKTEMKFYGRSQLNVSRSLIHTPRISPIYQNDLDWFIVQNIAKGLEVNLEVNFSNTNCDIYAWWTDELSFDELNFDLNLLGVQLAANSKPERGSFIPKRNGDLAIGCFNHSNSTGTWNLLFNQTSFELESEGSRFEFDTYELGNNVECGFTVTGHSNNGIKVQREFTNLAITNYFVPEIENFTIDEPDSLDFTITWDIYDRNADDNHFYSLFFSQNAGDTWMLLATDLKNSSFYFDTRPFLAGDEWMLQVRAFDNDYATNPNATSIEECWPGLMNYSTIEAGSLGGQRRGPPPSRTHISTTITTTTISTDTTTLTTHPSFMIALPPTDEFIYFTLWWGVMPSSLVIIVVFSYLILKARRKQTGYWQNP